MFSVLVSYEVCIYARKDLEHGMSSSFVKSIEHMCRDMFKGIIKATASFIKGDLMRETDPFCYEVGLRDEEATATCWAAVQFHNRLMTSF